MIRPITHDDALTWERLRGELWPDGRADHADEIQSFFAGTLIEPVAVLVAEQEGAGIVGLAELSLRADLRAGQLTGYIEGLYIRPEYRGGSTLRLLLAASRQWALRQGCTAFASDRAGRLIFDRSFPAGN